MKGLQSAPDWVGFQGGFRRRCSRGLLQLGREFEPDAAVLALLGSIRFRGEGPGGQQFC